MKTTAKYKDFSFNKEGDIELTLTIDRKYLNQVIELENTHNDKYFNLVTNDRVAQRTELQNNATWKLIRMINEKEHGESNKDLENELYCNIIKFAQIRIEYLEGLEIALESLQRVYRVVEIVDTRTSIKGVETCVFALYGGLSTFDKEENARFIKTLLDYSGKLGLGVTLETEQLRNLLK